MVLLIHWNFRIKTLKLLAFKSIYILSNLITLLLMVKSPRENLRLKNI